MKKVIHSRGDFVNMPGHHSDGSVFSQIYIENSKYSEGSYMEADLKFTDCNKTVSFSFDFDTPEERKNNLYKVDKMIENLKEFRKGLVMAHRFKTKKKEKTIEKVINPTNND